MKQLTCEMCGSVDLIKQDGYYVCQSCGCKYSTEESKKLMVEGIAAVQGTVKIDSKDAINEQISIWEKMAGDAFNNSNYDEAYIYYCKIVEKQVNHWFATYRKGMCLGWKANIVNMHTNEVVGGVIDASKLLYDDETQTDTLKAKGTLIMATELYCWMQALSNLAVNHCNEFGNKLVSAAQDFYQHECTISKLIMFVMNMFTEFTYQSSDNKDGLSDLISTICQFGRNTIENMNATFLVKTGEKRNSFWGIYQDVFENVSPDSNTIKMRNKLSSAITALENKISSWKEAEKKKVDAEIRNNTLTDSKNKDVSTLFYLAIQNLKSRQSAEAEARFDTIIDKLPNERLGYLGKAVSLADNSAGCSYDALFEHVIKAKNKTVSPEYQVETKQILDFQTGIYGTTLLMFACDAKRLTVVEALLEMGADIHIRTNANTTALWYVCFKAIPQEQQLESRKIARILLDKGAEADITNKGGVSLYNKDTDIEISQMLLDKFPQLKKREPTTSGYTSSDGCYVATCVYGSYDCPQVWTLRRYRDNTLGATWYGRLFIRIYYAVSPTLVKWFGKTKRFHNLRKKVLDNKVKRLHKKGFKDTPYTDIDWRQK